MDSAQQMHAGCRGQRWKRLGVAALLVGLFGALVAVTVLYDFAIELYRKDLALRLDPTLARTFSAANEALPAPAAGQQRVVYFGDSRVQEWTPLPELPGVQEVNRGYGGETTGMARLRLDRDVLSLQPDVVVMQLGINDLKAIGVFPELEERIAADCQKNIFEMLARLSENDIPVVLLTVIPPRRVSLARVPIWSARIGVALSEVNRALGADGRETIQVVDCSALAGEEGTLKAEYAKDDLHLNAEGYSALNDIVTPVLRRALTGDQ